jgi:hypothetical protein
VRLPGNRFSLHKDNASYAHNVQYVRGELMRFEETVSEYCISLLSSVSMKNSCYEHISIRDTDLHLPLAHTEIEADTSAY